VFFSLIECFVGEEECRYHLRPEVREGNIKAAASHGRTVK
jgi:hypothetical protein